MNRFLAIKIFLFITLTLFLVGCGKSPFLKTTPKAGSTGSQSGKATIYSEISLKNYQINISPFWREGPFIGDESKLLIILTNNQNVPIDVTGKLKIKLWMPDMNHGSYPVTIQRVGIGIFEVRDLYFTMEGFWNIHFELFINEQLVEEAKWGITL